MLSTDIEIISNAFLQQGWNKPASQYAQYFNEQHEGKRSVLIANRADTFAGYLTLVWESSYPPFQTQNVPEIVDFNVLLKYQRQGIGKALMEAAEQIAAKRSNIVGIGVGLTADYGAAQRLYVKRGYIPDGLGIFQQGQHLKHGEQAIVDDDLTLYFTKHLK